MLALRYKHFFLTKIFFEKTSMAMKVKTTPDYRSPELGDLDHRGTLEAIILARKLREEGN